MHKDRRNGWGILDVFVNPASVGTQGLVMDQSTQQPFEFNYCQDSERWRLVGNYQLGSSPRSRFPRLVPIDRARSSGFFQHGLRRGIYSNILR
jgi:hypothetical protein